jgi:hypothetical protein
VARGRKWYFAGITRSVDGIREQPREQKPSLKLDYNSLTNLSHPTESAAMNSFAAALRRLKSDGAEAMTKEAEEKDQLRIPYALQRLIWLVIDQDSRFIRIPIADADIPHSIEFFEAR